MASLPNCLGSAPSQSEYTPSTAVATSRCAAFQSAVFCSFAPPFWTDLWPKWTAGCSFSLGWHGPFSCIEEEFNALGRAFVFP